MTSFLEDYLREYLKFNDIDLYNYKNSDNYTKIKNKQLFLPSVGNISFDDLIERFLADKNQLLSHLKVYIIWGIFMKLKLMMKNTKTTAWLWRLFRNSI